MRITLPRQPLLIPLILALAASAAFSQDPWTVAARKIHKDYQDAVLWVSAVAKINFSAEGGKELPGNVPEQETKMETLGTLIDSRGLILTSLSQIDPARQVSGREFRIGGNMVKIEAVATLKEVKVTMPDGTDIPAEIVMKDSDLDLAFIRIKLASKEAQGITFKAVNLEEGARGEIAEDVVTLARMDEVLNRTATVSRGQITALTRKPREFFRVNNAMQGCPTFLTNGRLLGIAVSRSARNNKSSQTVVMPAAELLEIARQAPAAAPATESKPLKKNSE
jgi:S1-C subfamily serine protease